MFLERGADVYAYWNVTTYWVVPKDFLTGIGKSRVLRGHRDAHRLLQRA